MEPSKAIPAEHRKLLAGYRMPAEWEPHLATYLVWPHNRDTWPGKFEVIPPVFAQMVAAIAEFEPVRILADSDDAIEEIRATIATAASRSALGRVEIFTLPTNDSWIRDHGPIFVNRNAATGGGRAQIALDWRFSSWGEKYGRFDLDDVVPHRLAERYGFELIEPGIVLEGGSIDVNGAGALLTTESCLLNPNRNPHLGRAEIEDYLSTYLGVTDVIWLGDGIAGDDTDGHVDDLARFVAVDTIVTVVEEDPADENFSALQDNSKRLRAMRDRSGRPFRVETLPMPRPIHYDNTRLPASYANFYIVNGAVVMPTFGCPADAVAAATLARLFTERRVIRIPSTDLVWGLGAIHCLTQQHPRFASSSASTKDNVQRGA
ncbi:MAG: agmatine deiminase family protein [Candidatus Binataceae bacterium]